MNLVIDVGNTRVKLAVFQDAEILEVSQCVLSELLNTIEIIRNAFDVQKAIISSVVDLDDAIKESLNHSFGVVLILDRDTKLPFDNKYDTPDTLGVDRLALVAGASVMFLNTNVLVIDAGTCITYDVLNDKNEFLGGSISPGVEMRYRAVHEFTGKLPLLDKNEPQNLVGKSTKEAIDSGVINGVVFEILGVIREYEQQFGKIQVVLCGGDGNFLAKRLKSGIFVEPNFLLIGLNSILNYNNNNVE